MERCGYERRNTNQQVHDEEALMSRVRKVLVAIATAASAIWLVTFVVRFIALGSPAPGVVDGVFVLANGVLFLLYYRDAATHPRVPGRSRETWRIIVFVGGGISQAIYFARFLM